MNRVGGIYPPAILSRRQGDDGHTKRGRVGASESSLPQVSAFAGSTTYSATSRHLQARKMSLREDLGRHMLIRRNYLMLAKIICALMAII